MSKLTKAQRDDLGIGERVRALRAQRDLTLQEVADRCGMTNCTCLEVFGEDPDCPVHSFEAMFDRLLTLEAILCQARDLLADLTGDNANLSTLHLYARAVEIEARARSVLGGE